MIHDAQGLFSDAQAITAAAASTNYIDLGAARDIGVGQELYIVAQVDVAFTDGSSDSTLTVTIESDDNSSFSSATVVQTVGTFAALSAAGARLVARVQSFTTPERYIRVYYTPNNGNLTTGSVTAFLANGVDSIRTYADNTTIS